MKRIITCAAGILLAATFFTGQASAEELRGRFAVDARIGVVNPTDNEINGVIGGVGHRIVVPTDAGLTFGGGLLYGIDDHVGLEMGIDRFEVSTPGINDLGFGNVEVKDLSFGVQYRFPEQSHLVPYLGAGIDVLINDASAREISAIDTVFGAHLKAGVDYFLNRQLAINGELKGLEAVSADVKDNSGAKIGRFDPTSVSFTVGVRFFFN